MALNAAPTQPAVGDYATAAWADLVAGATGADDTTWNTLTLGNSWVSYDSGVTYAIPQYRLLDGEVIVQGMMKSGTAAATVATLPSSYRPLKKLLFYCVASGGGAQVSVTSTGVITVDLYTGSGSNVYVSLDNIRFPAEQ